VNGARGLVRLKTRLLSVLIWGLVIVLIGCAEEEPLVMEANALLTSFAGALAQSDAREALGSLDRDSLADLSSVAGANKHLRAQVASLPGVKDRKTALAWLSKARCPKALDSPTLLTEILSARGELELSGPAKAGLRVDQIEESSDGTLAVTTQGGSVWTLVRDKDTQGLRVRLGEEERRSLRTAKERLERLAERLTAWTQERKRLRTGWSQ
jgi:hypothetical protein